MCKMEIRIIERRKVEQPILSVKMQSFSLLDSGKKCKSNLLFFLMNEQDVPFSLGQDVPKF